MATALEFRRDRDPGAEALRILRREAETALAHLDAFEQDPEVHVHEARRAFRRIRSLLRLLRHTNPYTYGIENRFYQELNRSLSAARDRDAALEIAGKLQKQLSGTSGQTGEPSFLIQRLVIEASRLRAPVDPDELQHNVYTATQRLETALRRYRSLDFSALTRKKLRKAIRLTMRHVRQNYRRAAVTDLEEDFHELRKHARYALSQLIMCERIEPTSTPELQAGLTKLTKVLGTHQDLCVISELLPEPRGGLQLDDALQELHGLIETSKRDLRRKALVQARAMLAGIDDGPSRRKRKGKDKGAKEQGARVALSNR